VDDRQVAWAKGLKVSRVTPTAPTCGCCNWVLMVFFLHGFLRENLGGRPAAQLWCLGAAAAAT
jgi:hypothetical protein